MSEPPRRCPECDAPIPANSPIGLCPRCLLMARTDSQSAAIEPGPTKLTPPASGFVPPTVAELAPLFPQLEILELLGKGGMGAVYKARQPGLDRLVAVKILPPEISHDPAFTERFQREARALARLSHPHIVAVYDFGTTERIQASGGSLCYIVMEFVDGANLRQAIQTKKLAPVEALAIVPQICEALQFAHDEGIVHRDIKPENILIDKRGRVKIADFGLAKLLGQDASDHSLTAKHQVMGTLRYMAPEQMQGSREVDHRADIYSLGVVFYELLTGELPMGRFAPPSKRVQVDVRLDEIVLRALEQQPEQRYQHVSELKTDVEHVTSGLKFDVVQAPQLPSRNEQIEAARHYCSEPRFSRFAIAGAVWALFGMIGFIPIGYFIMLNRVWNGIALPTDLIHEQPPLAMTIFMGALLAIGVGSPIGTPIYGAVAIRQIKRSGGAIVGLPLAVANVLIVPLLIVGFGVFVLTQLAQIAIWTEAHTQYLYKNGVLSGYLAPNETLRPNKMFLVLDTLAALLVSILIARLVWRVIARHKRSESAIEPNQVSLPSAPPAEKRGAGPVLLPGPHLVQGPADCLLLAAGIAFVTACGVAVWLGVTASRENNVSNSMGRGNLIGMSVALATYSLFVGGASLMLRRLQARIFVLLVVVIVGLFFPTVCALNVVMELRNIPVWPVVIPLWLGMPAALWVVVRLFRDDVRGAFDAAGQRRLRDFNNSPQQTPSIASEPRISRFAIAGAVWALFGLLAIIPTLYFIGLNRVWNGTALPTDVIHSEPPLVFSIFMGALLAIGSGAPIGTTIYGGIAIGHIKRSGGQIIGLPLAVADVLFFPLLVLGGIIAALIARVGYSIAPHPNAAAVTSAGAFGVLVALVIGFFVTRAVWRAISRQGKNTVKQPGPDSSLRVANTKPPEAMVAQESLPYLLGWLVHWLLQERWFVALLQMATALIYAACLIAFVSFQSTNTQTPDGLVTRFHVGQPSAWLTLDASPSGQHASFEFLTQTHFVALFGLASLIVYRWLERRQTGKSHSMNWHYCVWGMFLAGAIGLGLFTLSRTPGRSNVSPLGKITNGIGAEFTVPAGQVAVFEIVTRRDGETVPVPPHCGYVMAAKDAPVAGTFRWARKPTTLASGTVKEWGLQIRTSGGGGGYSEGALVPEELNSIVGGMVLGLNDLPSNEELVFWGTADANNLPANGLIGLRVTVVSHGLETAGGSGFGQIDWKKSQSASSTTRRKLPIAAP